MLRNVHRLHFMRRVRNRAGDWRVYEIPVGRIHGHRKLGFDAATKTNGHEPIEIADWTQAKRQADALNLNLADCGIVPPRGRVCVVAV